MVSTYILIILVHVAISNEKALQYTYKQTHYLVCFYPGKSLDTVCSRRKVVSAFRVASPHMRSWLARRRGASC